MLCFLDGLEEKKIIWTDDFKCMKRMNCKENYKGLECLVQFWGIIYLMTQLWPDGLNLYAEPG